MAPPASRRSKQNSSPSPPPPVPLSGIAVGLFAAIAAGFAASRLRRKKPVQSLQDEQSAISAGTSIPLLVQEREIEIKEKDDLKDSAILADSNGVIAVATHVPAKLVAGLKPVFDALEETALMQKNGADPVEEGWQQGEEEEEEEEEEEGEFQKKNGANAEAEEADKGGEDAEDEEKEAEKGGEDDEGKKKETLENEEIDEEEGITLKIEAPLVVDVAFMDALDLGENEDEAEDEDDIGDAYQQPSAVLINGRILDFLKEMSDLKDDTDLVSSGSNSLSDAISESSMQEVSSAPVKPFNVEESMEASWTTEKPDFVSASNQLGHEEAFSESRNCSSLPYTEKNLPEIEENLNPFEPDVDAGVTVTVEIEEEELSMDKVNQINLEVISDFLDVRGDSAALQGEVSIEVNGLDEGFADSARINGKVLSDDLPLPEQLSKSKVIEKGECMLPAREEGSDDITGLEFEEETIAVSVRINGTVLSDDSPNDPCISEVMATDEPDGTVFGILGGEPDLQAIREVSGDNLSVKSERALHFESMEEVACMESDPLKELLTVDGISEELVLQSDGQDDEVVDGTSAVIHKNSVDTVVHEQPSLSIASTEENTEDNELDFEASTRDIELDSGRKDDDVLAEATTVDGRVDAKQQEIEEITSDSNNLNFTSKKPASLTDSARVLYNNTREVDHLVSKVAGHESDLLVPKGARHKVSLQAKGRSLSKVLKYLPLEIGISCFLIALVSFVLWYLDIMSSPQL